MKKLNLVLGMMLAGATGMVAADSLYIDASGKVGIGTNVPDVNVHVLDSGAAGPKTLFRIENTGNTKFGVKNNEAATEWAFANPGSEFRLSRQGSGVVEMAVQTGGNVVIAGVLTQGSDRNSKTNIKEVNAEDILDKVAKLPISSWSYKHQLGAKHIGPMAQDFYQTFGLGDNDKRIATLDTSGVALAAIQALTKKIGVLEAQIAEQKQQLNEQKVVQARLEALEAITVKLVQDRGVNRLHTASFVK